MRFYGNQSITEKCHFGVFVRWSVKCSHFSTVSALCIYLRQSRGQMERSHVIHFFLSHPFHVAHIPFMSRRGKDLN